MKDTEEYSVKSAERRVVRKARVIADDSSHVLAKCYELLRSGRRFRVPKSNTINQYLLSISFVNRSSKSVQTSLRAVVSVCKLR